MPKDCNVANSKFHYKKGTKTDPKYFRPIFLLPMVSKIIGKVTHDQTMNYLKETTFSTDTNQGFARTIQQALFFSYLTDKILTGVDSCLLTGMILMDLQNLLTS